MGPFPSPVISFKSTVSQISTPSGHASDTNATHTVTGPFKNKPKDRSITSLPLFIISPLTLQFRTAPSGKSAEPTVTYSK